MSHPLVPPPHRPLQLAPSHLLGTWSPLAASPHGKTSPSPEMMKRGYDERTTEDSIMSENIRMEKVEKIHYSLLLLSCMSLSAILFSLLSLVCFFLSSKGQQALFTPSSHPQAVTIVIEIVNSLDVVVIISSLATFFCSTFQIFFSVRQLKHSPSNLDTVVEYLRGNGFTRIVVYSFWFASILAFIVVIVLSALLSPYRGSVSKGVALSAGVSALVLCCVALLRSVWIFSRIPIVSVRPLGKYENYSTLV